MKNKSLCLSFDVEEFDLPREYGREISDKDMLEISYKGCRRLLEFLNRNNLKSTLFVSAIFAQAYPRLIREFAENNEIALHCYSHADYDKDDIRGLKDAKGILERISRQKVTGFRAPKFGKVNYKVLNEIGIKYDSSSHPTWIPGRYNNFFGSRKIKEKDGVKVIPVSVMPFIRAPLFWLAFRNFGLGYAKLGTRACLLNQDYVNLVFHPWEFIRLEELNLNLPKIITRNTGDRLENMLEKYVNWCKDKGFKIKTLKEI